MRAALVPDMTISTILPSGGSSLQDGMIVGIVMSGTKSPHEQWLVRRDCRDVWHEEPYKRSALVDAYAQRVLGARQSDNPENYVIVREGFWCQT